jgi:diguanylate cyclase (GGDEF)-like protein
LVVEDSKTFGSLMRRLVERELGRPCVVARSYRECAAALKEAARPFAAALTDLNLPDAPSGRVVDLVLRHAVPAIVFTGEMNQGLREMMWSKRIVDYVHKRDAHDVNYVAGLLRRLLRNRAMKTLVVDDSEMARRHVAGLLAAHGYEVLQAENARAALRVMDSEPGVKLVIVDYAMPGMDGAALTWAIRQKWSKNQLAVIGVSGLDDAEISVKLLKSGANDYLSKPFQTEEFYCRVSQNIDMLNMIEDISHMASRDFLTGLHNRKYLYETGEQLFANQTRKNLQLTAGMMDIDFFKKINDTHGHAAGDAVLKHFAQLLRTRFRRTDVVARVGGEEFCVLNVNLTPENARKIYGEFREAVSLARVRHEGQEIAYTVSIGVSTEPAATFEDCLKAADALLYRSKQQGRDRVSVV